MKYVYTHSIDGVVFYVGCGNKKRPYNLTDRSKRWKEYVSLFGCPDVSVVAEFETKQDALLHEYELIDSHSPCCNVIRSRGSRKMRTIQTIIEDETYAKLLSLSQNDKRTLSFWVREAIEKEIKSRELKADKK